MRRFCVVLLAGLLLLTVAASAVAQNAAPPVGPPLGGTAQVQGSPQAGYVPPPPIRHTWPGGYRVIILEMMNTLMDHVIGRY
jgi:hypothetical protein